MALAATDAAEHAAVNRAALTVWPVQVNRRGARRQPVPAFRIGQHVGQGVGEIILGGGDDAAQLWRARAVTA